MLENKSPHWQGPGDSTPPPDEGGLRAPPGLSPLGKVWWWFHFLILVKLARLRFIVILLAIGFVIVKWDTLVAYYDKWTRPAGAGQKQSGGADIEYFCPMHPTVVRDNPKEKCPICFMPLSRRKKGLATAEALPPGIVNRLQLSPYRVVLAGIQTWKVAYVPLAKEITTVGFVEFNEREMKHVAARVKGRLDTLYVNETGQLIRAGDALASLYSPDLNVTVQNLLDAKRSGNSELLRVAQDRLTLWGISQDQIETVLKTGKANSHLTIRSPIDGHVLKKYVKEGQYVEEGSPLYDIVDLGTVWIQGHVYEEDMAFLPTYHRPLVAAKAKNLGLPVTANTRAFPAQAFTGRLTFILPHVDPDTRTVVVRFELDNPGHKLRPGTSATVKLRVPPAKVEILSTILTEDWWKHTALEGLLSGPGIGTGLASLIQASTRYALLSQGHVLAVPESAVIDTGGQKIVYREVVAGEYEGVTVELGPRMAGPEEVSFYPVLRGLQARDLVVTAGSFLVDAETRLNPAAGSIYYGGSAGSKGQSSVSHVRPSTPADEDAKVKVALAKLPGDDRRLAEAQGYCPVLGSRLGSMGTPVKLLLEMEPVFLCCASCESQARAKPKDILAKAQAFKMKAGKHGPRRLSKEEAEIHAALAKLSANDRRLAEMQKLCPVTGEPLGSMGVPVKIMVMEEAVFLCCDGCNDAARASPAQTLAKVKQLRAKSRVSPK